MAPIDLHTLPLFITSHSDDSKQLCVIIIVIDCAIALLHLTMQVITANAQPLQTALTNNALVTPVHSSTSSRVWAFAGDIVLTIRFLGLCAAIFGALY